MSNSILAKVGRMFLQEEARRTKRPKLAPQERVELMRELHAVTGVVEAESPDNSERALRGQAAMDLFGYHDDGKSDHVTEVAANVVADILHAAKAAGQEPTHVIARARAYYYEELQQELTQKKAV